MEAKIGIRADCLTGVALSLAHLLADEYILYAKTRKAPWCVTGQDFLSKHLFFETQYHTLGETINEVAERIRTLGHVRPATLQEFLVLTHLTEQHRADNSRFNYIRELLADGESSLIHLLENISGYANRLHNLGASDYLTGLREQHEKMSWMLSAHLE